jgi:hypothetical protein
VALQVQEYTTGWQRAGDPTKRTVWLATPGQWYPVTVDHVAAASGHRLPVSVYSSDLSAPLLVDDCTLTG